MLVTTEEETASRFDARSSQFSSEVNCQQAFFFSDRVKNEDACCMLREIDFPERRYLCWKR